jgi:hypothetical protein
MSINGCTLTTVRGRLFKLAQIRNSQYNQERVFWAIDIPYGQLTTLAQLNGFVPDEKSDGMDVSVNKPTSTPVICDCPGCGVRIEVRYQQLAQGFCRTNTCPFFRTIKRTHFRMFDLALECLERKQVVVLTDGEVLSVTGRFNRRCLLCNAVSNAVVKLFLEGNTWCTNRDCDSYIPVSRTSTRQSYMQCVRSNHPLWHITENTHPLNTPELRVIAVFSGQDEVAETVGVHVSTVHSLWKSNEERRGDFVWMKCANRSEPRYRDPNISLEQLSHKRYVSNRTSELGLSTFREWYNKQTEPKYELLTEDTNDFKVSIYDQVTRNLQELTLRCKQCHHVVSSVRTGNLLHGQGGCKYCAKQELCESETCEWCDQRTFSYWYEHAKDPPFDLLTESTADFDVNLYALVTCGSHTELLLRCKSCTHVIQIPACNATRRDQSTTAPCKYCCGMVEYCDDTECKMCPTWSFNYWFEINQHRIRYTLLEHSRPDFDIALYNKRKSDTRLHLQCMDCPHVFVADINHLKSFRECGYCRDKLCGDVTCNWCWDRSCANQLSTLRYWYQCGDDETTLPAHLVRRMSSISRWWKCSRQCGRLVFRSPGSVHTAENPQLYCDVCWTDLGLRNVIDDKLECLGCKQWLPRGAFGKRGGTGLGSARPIARCLPCHRLQIACESCHISAKNRSYGKLCAECFHTQHPENGRTVLVRRKERQLGISLHAHYGQDKFINNRKIVGGASLCVTSLR